MVLPPGPSLIRQWVHQCVGVRGSGGGDLLVSVFVDVMWNLGCGELKVMVTWSLSRVVGDGGSGEGRVCVLSGGSLSKGPGSVGIHFFLKESYELVDSIDGRGYDTYHYEESGVWFRLAVGDRYPQARIRSFEEGHCC